MLRVFGGLQSYVVKLHRRDYLPIIKEDEIDFVAIYRVLYRGRWLIASVATSCVILSIIMALLLTPVYRASISIYPYAASTPNLGALTGLVASLGANLGASGTSLHIPDIVKSRWVRTDLIYNEWDTTKYPEPADLITYWELEDSGGPGAGLNPFTWIKRWIASSDAGLEDRTAVLLEDLALEVLSDRISVSENPVGLVRVDVWMEEPQLAADVANKIYDLVVAYAVTTESKFARLNRQFIEQRREVGSTALRQAEAALTAFRQRNRNVTSSPELLMERERLIREVEIQTQVYITLQQQYELASIEEAKQTPSVAILDAAQPAAEKDKPRRRKIVLASLVLGVIAGTALTFLHNFAIGFAQRLNHQRTA